MPAQHLHALLVEDDDAYATMLQRELAAESGLPVSVERVRSLSDALLRLSAGAFDAVLLDLGLPDSSGLETFGRLQHAAGDTPIVVLTASDDDGLAVAAVHAGAQDYLVKSATDAALLGRSLRYACERARLRRSLIEREARFRALVDQSQEAITLLDEHRVALYNSRAVETVTGYSPDPASDGAHIVANLPYNVGTALLLRWLSGEAWPPWWRSLTLMFQREVAERIVAAPDSEHYGRLSVAAQWRSNARIAMAVHRSAFVPPPKVTSAVVHIVPAAMPEGVDAKMLERLTAAAFGQRRKMLRQSLKGLPGALDALEELGIDSQRRAETLSVDDFVAIGRRL